MIMITVTLSWQLSVLLRQLDGQHNLCSPPSHHPNMSYGIYILITSCNFHFINVLLLMLVAIPILSCISVIVLLFLLFLLFLVFLVFLLFLLLLVILMYVINLLIFFKRSYKRNSICHLLILPLMSIRLQCLLMTVALYSVVFFENPF